MQVTFSWVVTGDWWTVLGHRVGDGDRKLEPRSAVPHSKRTSTAPIMRPWRGIARL